MVLLRTAAYADGALIEVAGSPVRLRVSGRARRVSLRLDAARREVIATAPSARRLAEAVAFARERSAWMAGLLAELPAPLTIRPGVLIEVLGEPCRLVCAPGRTRWRPAAAAGEPLTLSAPSEGEAFARAVVRAIKARARTWLVERTEVYAARLGKPAPVVSLNDAKARWGSCTPPRRAGFGAAVEVGRVRYCWRLALAPAPVADYVVAHECAHLVEANHSPRFWAVVHGLVGDERPHRRWLREHGARLHAFGGG
jgi:predicted metal-dependent hydrolase